MKQIIPEVKDGLARQFTGDTQLFLEQLATQGNDATWYTTAFNPYPFGISPNEFQTQSKLQRIVQKAIQYVVTHYFIDTRIQRFISLSESVLSLLEPLYKNNYVLGCFRPDFLHDIDGNINICEINARFPVNGYFISHYINNLIPSLPYLHPSLRSIPGLAQVKSVFCQKFIAGSQIGIVKGCEKGWDIFFLDYELNKAGYTCRLLRPENLQVTEKSLGDLDGVFHYFVLELHQHELLQTLYSELLQNLSTSCGYFNDLRTIFIAHDKRLLAVFSSEDIMKDYLPQEEAAFLREHVVPTYVMSQSPEIVEEALAHPEAWIMKPHLLGKGAGIVFGKFSSPTEWEEIIKEKACSEYVLQRYVPQKKFPILTSLNGEVSIIPMHVVGMLPAFDDVFFGSGIYRASPKNIVNVSGGGTILFPVLIGDEHAE
ncbi:tubulin--tyrosine ligase family protein [Microcoleus sp. ZQ-A2]|nr:hypothetical protein [Microcoleus sp. FACHB-1]